MPDTLTVDIIANYCSEVAWLDSQLATGQIGRPTYLGRLVCLRAKYGFRIDDINLTVQ